jgi:hypothetical protein
MTICFLYGGGMNDDAHEIHPFRLWRMSRRMPLRKAALLLDTRYPHLCRVELGHRDLQMPLAKAMSRLSGIPIDTLANWTLPKEESDA